MVKVLSVGGSIVVPEFPDTDFLKKFSTLIRNWLSKDEERKLILVVGGGGPARIYQNAYKEIIDSLYLNTKRTVMKSKKNNDICNIQVDSLGLNYITFESQNKTLIQDFLDAININISLYPFANYNINDKKIDYFNK